MVAALALVVDEDFVLLFALGDGTSSSEVCPWRRRWPREGLAAEEVVVVSPRMVWCRPLVRDRRDGDGCGVRGINAGRRSPSSLVVERRTSSSSLSFGVADVVVVVLVVVLTFVFPFFVIVCLTLFSSCNTNQPNFALFFFPFGLKGYNDRRDKLLLSLKLLCFNDDDDQTMNADFEVFCRGNEHH